MPTDYLPQRFIDKIEIGDCWEWTANKVKDGYGRFKLDGRKWLAHRFAWTLLVGPIPDGLVTDHLCRNRACVNPDHLEMVTSDENNRRRVIVNQMDRVTHCKHRHQFTPENTIIRSDGTGRACRLCAQRRSRAYELRRPPRTRT